MTGSNAPDFLDLLNGGQVETVAFEALASGMADERVASLMAVAGWGDEFDSFAIGGTARDTTRGTAATRRDTADAQTATAMTNIRDAVRDLGGGPVIVGAKGGHLVALVRRQGAVTPEVACTAMAPSFADDAPLCLGSLRHGVAGASETLRGVLFALTAAPAVVGGHLLRPMRADDVLPERALLGDESARRELVESVYASLTAAGPDDPTMLTVSTFLASGSSLEMTAKELNVHPNTVRYRLKRAAETTGWDAADPREAYVLTTAIALGRIHTA